MTRNTLPSDASSKTVKTSVSHSTGKGRFVNIDDLVSDWEKDPETAQALADTRKRLAAEIPEEKFPFTRLRMEQGLSQRQLASLVGKEQSYIARIEKGDGNVTVNTINALAKALGVPAEQVFMAFHKRSLIAVS